jgi:hypothetical protein
MQLTDGMKEMLDHRKREQPTHYIVLAIQVLVTTIFVIDALGVRAFPLSADITVATICMALALFALWNARLSKTARNYRRLQRHRQETGQ